MTGSLFRFLKPGKVLRRERHYFAGLWMQAQAIYLKTKLRGGNKTVTGPAFSNFNVRHARRRDGFFNSTLEITPSRIMFMIM